MSKLSKKEAVFNALKNSDYSGLLKYRNYKNIGLGGSVDGGVSAMHHLVKMMNDLDRIDDLGNRLCSKIIDDWLTSDGKDARYIGDRSLTHNLARDLFGGLDEDSFSKIYANLSNESKNVLLNITNGWYAEDQAEYGSALNYFIRNEMQRVGKFEKLVEHIGLQNFQHEQKVPFDALVDLDPNNFESVWSAYLLQGGRDTDVAEIYLSAFNNIGSKYLWDNLGVSGPTKCYLSIALQAYLRDDPNFSKILKSGIDFNSPHLTVKSKKFSFEEVSDAIAVNRELSNRAKFLAYKNSSEAINILDDILKSRKSSPLV